MTDDRPPADEQGFTLRVLTSDAALPLDGQSRVAVEITRTGVFTGPVSLAGASLPNGVTVMPVTIAAGATTADVIVGGAAPLAIGGKVTFSIEGTGDGVDPQTVMVTDAQIIGRPGSLDTTFGPGSGLATISFGADDGGTFTALDVINGSVLATGFGVGGLGAVRMTTMRFTAAGAVDATWNGGALARTSFGGSSGDNARAFALGQQTDGRSIAIGFHNGSGLGDDIAVTRFSLTGGAGGVDFGSLSGRGLVDLGGSEVVNDGLVTSQSSIIAVGVKDGHFFVARVSASGFLDTGFAAPNGFERVVLGTASQADAVTADGQDRILVAGTFTVGGQTDVVLRRYTTDGRIDGAFGTQGQVIVAGAAFEHAVAVKTIGDKIVLATTSTEAGATSVRVRRYLANGDADATFGAQGLAELPAAAATRMAILTDGSIVVLGNAAGQAQLARFTSRGEIDKLFGTGGSGKVSIFIGDSGSPAAIEVYDNHRIVIGGGNEGGVPGPGTFGVVGRVWM